MVNAFAPILRWRNVVPLSIRMDSPTMVEGSTLPMMSSSSSPANNDQNSRRGLSTRKDSLICFTGFIMAPLVLEQGSLSVAAAAEDSSGTSKKKERISKDELQFLLFKKGLQLTKSFEFEEAEDVYTTLIEVLGNPNRAAERDKHLIARAYSNRGNVRSMLNRVEEALVDYSAAIALSADVPEFWTNRGLAYESIADSLLQARENDAHQFYEAAMQDYDHAIILDPENHRLYVTAGDVLTHLKKNEAALDYYRRALTLSPASVSSRGKVALMEVETGNVARGIFLVDSILKRNPDFAEMVLASAALGWNLGRFAEGMDLYALSVERDPRLLDDRYLEMECHWPASMLKMVGKLRQAGTMDGYRATAVSWFSDAGQLI